MTPFGSNGSYLAGAPSLNGYEFTFEAFLQDSARIEPDPDPTNEVFDSASLCESIAKYEEENGRTYHSFHAGSYPYPNDPTETERLNELHGLVRQILDGRNHLAPFSRANAPRRVLDIATGTGTWAIEMADDYPEAQIIGTDLSPIQPYHVPPNLRFFVEDSCDDWDYTRKFDYIHTRMTLGCWADMKRQIIQKAFDNLTPGGYIEAQELYYIPHCDDNTLHADSALMNWTRDINAASEEADRQLCIGPELKAWMEEVGFEDVHESVFKVPINGWPKEPGLKHIGQLWQRNMLNGLSGFSLGLFHRINGRTMEDIELQLVDVRRELFDQSIHTYQKIYVVWGRKPES